MWNRLFKLIPILFIWGMCHAQVVLNEFNEDTVPILNEELRVIQEDIYDMSGIVQDKDKDTKIQVEEASDEDKIRFDTGGTQRATMDSLGFCLQSGVSVNEFSIDGTLGGNSNSAVPTEKAVKTYVDAIADEVTSSDTAAFLVFAANQENFASGATITYSTKIYDTGSNFASYTFTAPETGRYVLTALVDLYTVDADYTILTVNIVTSNRTYTKVVEPNDFIGDDCRYAMEITTIADMDTNNTAYVTVTYGGGASQMTSATGGYFAGSLI